MFKNTSESGFQFGNEYIYRIISMCNIDTLPDTRLKVLPFITSLGGGDHQFTTDPIIGSCLNTPCNQHISVTNKYTFSHKNNFWKHACNKRAQSTVTKLCKSNLFSLLRTLCITDVLHDKQVQA